MSITLDGFLAGFVSAPEKPLISVRADREVCNYKPLILLGRDTPVTPAIFQWLRLRPQDLNLSHRGLATHPVAQAVCIAPRGGSHGFRAQA
jgi:hypothetical protein